MSNHNAKTKSVDEALNFVNREMADRSIDEGEWNLHVAALLLAEEVRKLRSRLESSEALYARGVQKYWSSPVHHPLRGLPEYEEKAHQLGVLYERAAFMPEEEFNILSKRLYREGLDDGDLGYRYWSGVVDEVRALRVKPVEKRLQNGC